uniref:Uncharacterized protein n=1 Tax=viral metagenome TaxID=1070528 RepID=A0A6C0JK45_9ZZZZ
MKSKQLLNNIKLLYLVFVLFLINLGVFIYNRDNQSIFLFAVMALIIYFFNKNMIVVLIMPMIFINALLLINQINSKEGFTEKFDEDFDNQSDDSDDDSDDDNTLNVKGAEYNNDDNKKLIESIKQLVPASNKGNDIDINKLNTVLNKVHNIIQDV